MNYITKTVESLEDPDVNETIENKAQEKWRIFWYSSWYFWYNFIKKCMK